ncbi:MAG: FliA/WhiG family RNA polymerase sigma factor [Thermoleophilia bacterium]|jgi:RNA polymerase sigma factor for flagellar operon FliA
MTARYEKPTQLDETWRRYKEDHDSAAKDRLILAYSPLVKYVAGRMKVNLPPHVEEGDLISYGLLGLIGAMEKFDLSRNIKFETYAVSRIRGSIIDELRALDWVPRSVRSWARKVEAAVTRLENELMRTPTDEETAAYLELDITVFLDIVNQISTSGIVALDEFWNTSGSGQDRLNLIDTIEDTDAPDPSREYTVQALKETLAAAIQRLPERERIVVSLYYYEGFTLKEIGEVLGVTESRVSQLHTKAILRLRGRVKEEIDPDVLL